MRPILSKDLSDLRDFGAGELTEIQRQAYINEFKGALFEFLVAQSLVRQGDVQDHLERHFFEAMPTSFWERLSSYERWMRLQMPELLDGLSHLALITAERIAKALGPGRPTDVRLLGRLLLEGCKPGQDEGGGHSEADLLVHWAGRAVPVSLKLSKANAYVNTKSAGIFSVLEKYFGVFPRAQKLQEEVAQETRAAFQEMAFECYQMAGLPELPSGRFFGAEWKALGLSDLPGQLPAAMAPIIQKFYCRSIKALYEAMRALAQEDARLFAECLLPLCGHAHAGILQVTCYYQKGYRPGQITAAWAGDFRLWVQEFSLAPFKEGAGSFEIGLPGHDLQIRVKPMNRFTLPGLKINCSLKKVEL